MVAKKKIKSPLVTLNGIDNSLARNIYAEELAASESSLNKAQLKVLSVFNTYQEIPEHRNQGFTGRGMAVIERMVFKNSKKTNQTYLYYGAKEIPALFKHAKVGETIILPISLTLFANPAEAQKHTEANGFVLIVQEAVTTPVRSDEEPDALGYVLGPEAVLKLEKVERITWANGSAISKNVSVYTTVMH